MLNFDEEVVEVKFKGEVHKISRPVNKQIKEYSDSLKAIEGDKEKEELLIAFLEKLGLKREVFDQLTPGQVKQILKELHDSEKN